MRRTQAFGLDHFDVPMSETLTSQHLVWLREPDQLLVRVEANQKLKSGHGSRIRVKGIARAVKKDLGPTTDVERRGAVKGIARAVKKDLGPTTDVERRSFPSE
ncbi:uncharacterized protein A4U43_C04F23300 [Asparagus officinalis]|uniref:Uncharacterized protein n=1 Tax=Asparagus officinalis TaxID=4686 RepID=A0A5P1F4X5_ASPOF|nr:uncharacterized protein A4U43_C04F23300 [Asparagus officinalis]